MKEGVETMMTKITLQVFDRMGHKLNTYLDQVATEAAIGQPGKLYFFNRRGYTIKRKAQANKEHWVLDVLVDCSLPGY
jgi:hypothetical protein